MNYLKTHKAVVRVSPEVPLHTIIPAICEKCEVSPEQVVLLRDNITGEELELTKSLDELGIKELYAWDRKRGESRLTASAMALVIYQRLHMISIYIFVALKPDLNRRVTFMSALQSYSCFIIKASSNSKDNSAFSCHPGVPRM